MPQAEEFAETKVDRELYGVFREEGNTTVGDPFTKPPDKSGRYAGKQFGVPFQPKGTGRDAWIDKNMKLTVPGDKYVEPGAIEKLLASRGGGTVGKAFVPSNPSPHPTGAGSLYGVFGPANSLLDTDPTPIKKPEKGMEAGRRSIYVSPAKKGTYGFPIQDRTLGGNKFNFIPDEFERGRALEKQDKKDSRAKFAKPFVSTGRVNRGIVPMGLATTPGPDRKTARDPEDDKRKPWKYNNPPQKGPGHGTINKLVYVPQPTRELPKVVDQGPNNGKGFKPPGGPHGRLSMWSPNPFRFEARQPPDNDFSLLG